MDPTQRTHLILGDQPFLAFPFINNLREQHIPVDRRPPDANNLKGAILVVAATTIPFELLGAAAGVLEPAFIPGLHPWAHSNMQLRRAVEAARYYAVRQVLADDALLAAERVSVLIGTRHQRDHYARLLGKPWRWRDRLRPGRRPTLRRCGPHTGDLGGRHAAGVIDTLGLAATAASVTRETARGGPRTYKVRPLESGTG